MTKARLRWLSMIDAADVIRGLMPPEVSAEDLVVAAIGSGRLNARAMALKLPDSGGVSVEAVTWHIAQRYGGKRERIKIEYKKITAKQNRAILAGEGSLPSGFVFDIADSNISDWQEFASSFTTTLSGKHVGRYLISDVSVREKDLLRYMDERIHWERKIDEGRPRKELAWQRFCIALVALERDGRLTQHDFPDSRSLSAELLRFTDQALDSHTIRDSIKTLYCLLVPTANRNMLPQGATRDEEDFDLGAAMRDAAEAAKEG